MADSKEKKFKKDIDYRVYRLKHFASKHGWGIMDETPQELLFEKITLYGSSEIFLVINFINFEVDTVLTHPEKGDTHLKRKGPFTMKLIEAIFVNPRVHMPNDIKGQYVENS